MSRQGKAGQCGAGHGAIHRVNKSVDGLRFKAWRDAARRGWAGQGEARFFN